MPDLRPITKGMLQAANLLASDMGAFVFVLIWAGQTCFVSRERGGPDAAKSPDFGRVYRFWTGQPFEDGDPAPLVTQSMLANLDKLRDWLPKRLDMTIDLSRPGMRYELYSHIGGPFATSDYGEYVQELLRLSGPSFGFPARAN